nr:uncharacterized protein LOC124815281 [Hydra vulgaris]
MKGEYSGLQSKIKSQENQKSVYIWCYSHVLNLCVCDTCKGVEAKKLFGFLNRLSTFFSDSYKRMHIWLSEIDSSLGSNKLKKLQKIGENNTRWWSREKALFWIFDGDKCLFPTVVSALHHISISRNFEPKVCSEASSLLDNLCNFKIILTAHIFLNIFKIIGPTSRYLQTRGMDLLSAWSVVDSVKQEIGHLTFDNILEISVHFSNNMNDLLNSKAEKKGMYDELCADETPELPLDKFRVETYQSIVDHINNSLNERFTDNNQLIADVQYLIPKNFKQIEQMPNTALKHLANLAYLDHIQLCLELNNFSKMYPKLKMSTTERTKQIYRQFDTDSDENSDNDEENMNYDAAFSCNNKNSKHDTNNCLQCVYKLVYNLNMHISPYTQLCASYEFFLTLSVTEVNCERTFSKLKLFKTRLRANISQDSLEALLIMSVEKQLLNEIEISNVIEYLKASSTVMTKMFSI